MKAISEVRKSMEWETKDSSSPFDPIAQIDHQMDDQLQMLKMTACDTPQRGQLSMIALTSSKQPWWAIITV